jgi:hypothetical protein
MAVFPDTLGRSGLRVSKLGFGPGVAISLGGGTMFTVVALLWLFTDTASIE